MTLPEVILWEHLRKGRLTELRFRHQHPVGVYILDFYCSSARLAVEVDGAGHGHPEQARRDAARDGWLESMDIRMLRFAATDVLNEETLSGVLSLIAAAAAPSTPSGSPSPVKNGGG